LHISTIGFTLITDEKKAEMPKEQFNTTSQELADYSLLKFVGVNLITLLLSVLLF